MLNKGRILLIDDEPLVLEMFSSFLSEQGYDVLIAANAKDTLEILEKTYFEAIVCDVMLEDLDGFEILRIARKKNPAIASVLITGAPSEEDAKKAKSENSGYLSKPIGFDSLLETIEGVLANPNTNQAQSNA